MKSIKQYFKEATSLEQIKEASELIQGNLDLLYKTINSQVQDNEKENFNEAYQKLKSELIKTTDKDLITNHTKIFNSIEFLFLETNLNLQKKIIKKKDIELNEIKVERDKIEQSRNELQNKLVSDIDELVANKLKEDTDYFKKITKIKEDFAERIEGNLKSSTTKTNQNYFFFIASVSIIGITLTLPFFIDFLSNDWYVQLGFRFAVTLPLLWLASFFFGQFKYYKISQIKYSHIIDLIKEGGAEVIFNYIDDPKEKNKVIQKIVETILDTKELTNIYKNEKEPSSKFFQQSIELLKQATEIIKATSKTTKNK